MQVIKSSRTKISDKKCSVSSCDEYAIITRHNKGVFCKSCTRKNTLEVLKIKYGEDVGVEKYKQYRERQAKSNTFEYKRKKYGWTREQYEEFNLSRAVTLENMIKKHGEKDGKEKYDAYVESQKTRGTSLSYFIEQYGEVKGKSEYERVCSEKGLTLDNYIRRLGEERGTKEFLARVESRASKTFFSKESYEFFSDLVSTLNIDGAKFGDSEFGIMDTVNKNYYKYDFYYKGKVIEYNGVAFHPKTRDDKLFKNPFDSSITSEEAFDKDVTKRLLCENRGLGFLTIWSDEPYEIRMEKCKKFLNLK